MPDDLETFSVIANQASQQEMQRLLSEALTAIPKQEKMRFDEFATLAKLLIDKRNQEHLQGST